jgi:O-methyltransferase domain
VAQGARQHIDAAGLAGRCEVVSGDFFEAVPAGGDAYIIKSVIHDWEFEDSLAILKNVHAASASNARLLLVELVLPPCVEPAAGNRIIVGSDVNMLVNLGGRERTESEFSALFDAAKFRLNRVIATRGLWRVIEGVRLD